MLDWLWEHPVDFSRFPIEKGDQFEIVTRKEQPKAFVEWLPNFYALGFIEAEAHVVLKNGEPYNLEGHYIGRVAEEVVLAGDYYDEEEWTEVHWCITTEPNVYEKEESIGKLEDLTEEATLELLEENRKFALRLELHPRPGNKQRIYCSLERLPASWPPFPGKLLFLNMTV